MMKYAAHTECHIQIGFTEGEKMMACKQAGSSEEWKGKEGKLDRRGRNRKHSPWWKEKNTTDEMEKNMRLLRPF